ncbi:MAG: redox-regulated ATPase YchF [Gammaproteobacteria bacterium]
MALKCGIVGLPNVGKSTLFNALTSAGIDAQNFPFCTIEPNQGIVSVPDKRLHSISSIVNPEKVIPTTTEFVDIAGLVEGASKGEGLGNKFLSHIRETQAIIHVIRCFEDEDITHVNEKIDPISDLEIIETELLLADLETVSNAKEKVERIAKSGDKAVTNQYKILTALEEDLNKGILARDSKIAKDNDLKEFQLITLKPCLYLANIKEGGEENPNLVKLKEYAESRSNKVLALCNQIESEISELPEEDRVDFLKDMGMHEPGLNKLIRASYEILQLQTFFTAGKKEVRAWTIKKGSKAPQAAGEIHTDFERGFIKADTISYEDYIKFNGESGCKEAGKLRSEGSDYEVRDGDVIHFKFNV